MEFLHVQFYCEWSKFCCRLAYTNLTKAQCAKVEQGQLKFDKYIFTESNSVKARKASAMPKKRTIY